MSDAYCNDQIINYLNALINYKKSWIPQRKPDSKVHIPDNNCLYVIDNKINEISQSHQDFSNKNVEDLNVVQLNYLKDSFISLSNYNPNMSIKTTDELKIAKLEKNIKELENQRHNIGNFKEQKQFNDNLESLKEQLKEAQKGTTVYIGGKRRTKRRKSKKTTNKKGKKNRKSTRKSNKKLSKK
jgi:hypothetical protein